MLGTKATTTNDEADADWGWAATDAGARDARTTEVSGRCCYVLMRLMSAVRRERGRESIDSVGGGSGRRRYRRPVNGGVLMMQQLAHTYTPSGSIMPALRSACPSLSPSLPPSARPPDVSR